MIDRRSLVTRHDPLVSAPDAENPLTVGNGDFAFTVDATGLQTFTEHHDPIAAQAQGRVAVNTATMSSWGWHETPAPRPYTLEDAMSEYQTPRGLIRYPDRFDAKVVRGAPAPPEYAAGTWLRLNPHRIDLGRIGLALPAEGRDLVPDDISDVEQRLSLWVGIVRTRFRLKGQPVFVETAADPYGAIVAVRVASPLLEGGVLALRARFPFASDGANSTSDWASHSRHSSSIRTGANSALVQRRLDTTEYSVRFDWDAGTPVANESAHELLICGNAGSLELVASFSQSEEAASRRSAAEVFGAAAQWWPTFWNSGAAIDLSGISDSRAHELERRLVLSQYLTMVNCAGSMPPQETGLTTNSWHGKFHLEMHWWHGAHFAAWGRPELLRRSLSWYRSIATRARATAKDQSYPGLRWPKMVGPDGRESPSAIGSLLIWQQPHLLYMLELLYQQGQTDVVHLWGDLVKETAEFMVGFLERRHDGMHIPAPVMPAQEVYDARKTEDPTFELAYWWWGLEIAQRWREREGHARREDWDEVQRSIVRPVVREGVYAAVGAPPFTRRSDHPTLLAAYGFVPPTPLIDPLTMRATVGDVLNDWEWDSAWGWDFPVIAMTWAQLGEPVKAVEALLMDSPKNHYTLNGHCPQMGNELPIYLPANGGLLAAAAVIFGSATNVEFLRGAGWGGVAEGFREWPRAMPSSGATARASGH
ncbi:hypothetical protein [Streptomyces scopuliridis]|uniref:hypothetical protein n=1 Tax=Streptomyces scopuliridis TaxID=452529 RepID=UPI0036C869BC